MSGEGVPREERVDGSSSSAADARIERRAALRQRAESDTSAAFAGVVFAVLAIIGLVLLSGYPDLEQSDAEVAAWFDDAGNRSRLLAGLNAVGISAIALFWFVAVIRRRLGDREDPFFGTVFYGSAVVYVAVWVVAAAALASPAVATTMLGADSVTKASASLAAGHGGGLLLVVAPRLQAVFVFTTSTVILRSGILPSWLAIFGYVMGIVLFLMPIVFAPLGLGFPIWVFVVSVVMLTRRGHAEPAGDSGVESTDHAGGSSA